jgi:hypothetical protein
MMSMYRGCEALAEGGEADGRLHRAFARRPSTSILRQVMLVTAVLIGSHESRRWLSCCKGITSRLKCAIVSASQMSCSSAGPRGPATAAPAALVKRFVVDMTGSFGTEARE